MNLSNTELVAKLKSLVSEERKVLAEILDHLSEVARRKLYLDMGYSSLHEFCMKELKYSEACAQRRISAIKVIKAVPEIEGKLLSGELSLTVISQAQTYFNQKERDDKPLNTSQKIEVLKTLENTSTRQCERILGDLCPEMIKKDAVRAVSSENTEIRLTVDKEFMQKLEKLQNLYSHSNPNISIKEVLDKALDQLLIKKDPIRQPGRQRPQKENTPPAPEVASTRSIPQAFKREVWRRSKSQCCYMNPETQIRCSSQKFLEIDHIIPRSRGGTNHIENLQLLCGQHNRHKGARLLI